jgi:hypothetical protein
MAVLGAATHDFLCSHKKTLFPVIGEMALAPGENGSLRGWLFEQAVCWRLPVGRLLENG